MAVPDMATAALNRPTKMNSRQWTFLLLLVLSVCINYIDRGSLGIAGPIMIKELNLDPYQFGILLSAFFWTYAPMQIVSGWLVDRYNVNLVYGIGFLAWSAATLFTGFIGSFFSLLILRTILGMGESVAYPSYSKILSANFKEHHRGLANGLIDAGSKFGPALGVLLGGLFMAKYGWRVFFYSMGIASLLWLIPWYFFAPRDSIAEKIDMTNAPGVFRIMTVRSAWGNFFGLFCANYVWYFILTWLPYYLKNERHYSVNQMATFGSLPYWMVGLSSAFAGIVSDRLVARGGQAVKVRKFMIAAGLLGTTVILPSVMVQEQRLSLVLLMIGCFAFGFFSGIHWALAQSLAGPLASGKWTGLANGIGNVPGIVAPWFTGWVVRETGQFYYAFVVCAAFCILGAICYGGVIERNQPVDWV
jgi:ACS family D-galactonate transporter-like MFS transporter